MNTHITRWGIGPKFTCISVVYAASVFLLNHIYFPFLRFTLFSTTINMIVGSVLVVIGIPIFLLPTFTIDRYFYEGKLCTTGVYAFLRHPIYGAWITWIVPGIVIIRGSMLGISIPIFMYFVFRSLIDKEEKYLEMKFGEEYLDYKRTVGAVFPKLWKKKGAT
jgi:protein-S-isoprenylcysteine O-methyltransferase Ste14